MPRPLKFLMFLMAVPLVLVGIALGWAATKPNTWRVEVTGEISAPPATTYAAISSPRSWLMWSAWHVERDPTLRSTFDGPVEGKGATWMWTGEDLGRGRLVITASTFAERVEYDLFFAGSENPGHGTITLVPTPDGDRTRMTWVDEGDVGSGLLAVIGRLMVPTIEKMLEQDLDAGIRRLDARARAGKLAAPAAPK